jgi:ABC-2 type transport system ATP-binding protein
MIEIRDVSKSFNGIKALDHFSLQAGAGEIIGLVGPNGAGKTTLLKILATLLPSDEGEILIHGKTAVRKNKQLLGSIGYLADFAGIYQDMRVYEFLEFFVDAFHIPSDKRQQVIQTALRDANLLDRKDHFVEQLSFGLKQRLLLAKTTLHSPSVLLLDEPATGLDPIARDDLRLQLKRWLTPERTAVISSHILSDLEDICAEVVFIDKGKNAGIKRIEKASSTLKEELIVIEISVLSDRAEAAQIIEHYPSVRILNVSSSNFSIEIKGGEKGAADLLNRLIQSGVQVCRFNPRRHSLEETYRNAFGSKPE